MSLSPSKGSGRKSEAPDRMTSTAKYKDALLLRIITRDAGLPACKSPMKPRGLQQEPSSITAGGAPAAPTSAGDREPDRTSGGKARLRQSFGAASQQGRAVGYEEDSAWPSGVVIV